jgi:hypothetical protein
LRRGLIICSFGHKTRQPRTKSLLDSLGIGRGQSIFGAKNPMSPICSVLGGVNSPKFGHELLAQGGSGSSVGLGGFETGFARRPPKNC